MELIEETPITTLLSSLGDVAVDMSRYKSLAFVPISDEPVTFNFSNVSGHERFLIVWINEGIENVSKLTWAGTGITHMFINDEDQPLHLVGEVTVWEGIVMSTNEIVWRRLADVGGDPRINVLERMIG